MKKNIFFTTITTILLASILWFTFSHKKTIEPDLPITLVNGDSVKLKHLIQNKNVFMVFWATSCSSCMLELPKLDEEKKRTNNFDVIAVAMQYDEIDKVNNYVNSKKYDFSFAYDHDGSIAKLFNVNLTPTTIVVTKAGVIERKIIGNTNNKM